VTAQKPRFIEIPAEILKNRPFRDGLPLTARPEFAQTCATREAIQITEINSGN
jgi:hypothetical protein